MTIHNCPDCGSAHENVGPPCPTKVGSVVAPNANPRDVPQWGGKVFCPECPRHAQPQNGYCFIDFSKHALRHYEEKMDVLWRDLNQYYNSLLQIDDFLSHATPEDKHWKFFIQTFVNNSLRRALTG